MTYLFRYLIVTGGCLVWLLQGMLPAQAADPPPVMTLEQCLAYGVAHNPLLQSEQARVAQSQAVLTQTQAGTALGVDLRTSFQYYDELPASKANLLGPGHTDMIGELAVTRILYSWGKWEWRTRAATDGVLIAEAQQERIYQDTLNLIARFYAELWLREQIVRAKQQTLAQAEAHLQRTRDLVALGKAARVEEMRAEVNVATARDGHRRSVRERESVRMRLNQTMGRNPEEPIAVTPALPDVLLPDAAEHASWTMHPEW